VDKPYFWCLLAVTIFIIIILTACYPAHAEPAPPTPTVTLTPSPAPTWTPLPTRTPLAAATPAGACPVPDLGAGQHISASGSYTQSQTGAAGAIGCRIERDSCAYYHLVGDLNPTIVFKREEEPPFDEEDILMHPNMVLPLSRLSQLVRQEWGGAVQLRVTDAYDSLLEHDLGQPDENLKLSLHFEGRAVDLTTWPIEPARYPRLCALAHCAGFAWVHNEGTHCHAALKAESLCLRCK
jgi:hypothetical protein